METIKLTFETKDGKKVGEMETTITTLLLKERIEMIEWLEILLKYREEATNFMDYQGEIYLIKQILERLK